MNSISKKGINTLSCSYKDGFSVFRGTNAASTLIFETRYIGTLQLCLMAELISTDIDATCYTATVQSLFYHITNRRQTPLEIIHLVNQGIVPLFYNNGISMPCSLTTIDRTSGCATVVGSGHLPIIHKSRNGTITTIPCGGESLGVTEYPVISHRSLAIQKGDRFVLLNGVSNENETTTIIDHIAENAFADAQTIADLMPDAAKDKIVLMSVEI